MFPHRRVPLCYFIFFKYASTARLKSSAIGAPVFADSFLSLATSSSGSHTVVRFFIPATFYDVCQYMSILLLPRNETGKLTLAPHRGQAWSKEWPSNWQEHSM